MTPRRRLLGPKSNCNIIGLTRPKKVVFAANGRAAHMTLAKKATLFTPGTEKSRRTECIYSDTCITCVAFGNVVSGKHSGSLLLATGHSTGNISLWNADTSQLVTKLMSHSGLVTDLVFSPPSTCITQLLSVSTDSTAKLWDFEMDGYNMSQYKCHSNRLFCCDWSPNGSMVATGGLGRTLYMYEMKSFTIGRLRLELKGHSHNIVACKFWPDGALIASASWDTRVNIWDSFTGELRQTLCHTYPVPKLLFDAQVRCLDVDPYGTAIVTVADDDKLRLWTMDTTASDNNQVALNTEPNLILPLPDNIDCRSCSFGIHGTLLAVADVDSSVATLYALTRPVPKLSHLCRLSVRKVLENPRDLDQIPIPKRLKSFLSYELWL